MTLTPQAEDPLVADFFHCRSSQCTDACDLGFNGAPVVLNPEFATTCDDCANAQCEGAFEACASSRVCWEVFNCIVANPINDRLEARCLEPLEELGAESSGQVVTDFLQCVTQTCVSECGSGRNWSCVDTLSQVQAAPDDVLELTFEIFDFEGTPVPNVEVTACPSPPQPCDAPYAQAITNSEGLAPLTIDLSETPGIVGQLTGFGGVIRVHDPAGVHYDALYVPTYPLTQTGLQRALLAPRRDVFQGVIGLAGVNIEPGTAIVVAQARDCITFIAPDVQTRHDLEDSGATTLYLNGQIFSKNRDATDASGLSAIVNIPVSGDTGSISITAHLVQENRDLLTIPLPVAPDTLTIAILHAIPDP